MRKHLLLHGRFAGRLTFLEELWIGASRKLRRGKDPVPACRLLACGDCARTRGVFHSPKRTGPTTAATPTEANRSLLPELSFSARFGVMMRTMRFFSSAPVTPETQVSGAPTQNSQVFKMLSA